MKDQYFGDVRDLFKYDLIEHILSRMDCKQFSFIPMLTKPDATGDGDKKRDFCGAEVNARPGTKNEALFSFLKAYNMKSNGEKRSACERRIKDIRKYYERRGIDARIHSQSFKNVPRSEYFKGLGEDLLSCGLVFVDPDIGLQVKKPSDKHLQYCEVKDIYGGMGSESILMIYQHYPRDQKHRPEGRAKELREGVDLGYPPLWISDRQILFLFLSESSEIRNKLAQAIDEYRQRYPSRLEVSDSVKPHSARPEVRT